jgi:hypothetical protein
MKKLITLLVLAVVLPIFGLVVLVGAVTGAALNGAGAAGYDAGLTTCLSPPATQPWSASQMQVAALLTSVARKELSGSARGEQFAVAASIWQSSLTDLALTSTAALPASPAGVFAEGPSWGTLAQRTDSLSQAGLFDSKLQGTSWQSGDPWPVIRAVLGFPRYLLLTRRCPSFALTRRSLPFTATLWRRTRWHWHPGRPRTQVS